MKGRAGKDGEPRGKGGRFFGGSSKPAGSSNKAAAMKKKKQNVTRLGGGGLSLEAFANIKSTTNRNQYNPALIKKKREFYKNAKYISKYKKSLKHLSEPNDPSAMKPSEDTKEMDKSKKRNKNEKRGSNSLRELYEKKREEEEIARKEREVVAQAKKEEREKAEARRKAERVKMFKKTRSGQPVMKYRIEHLLQSMQGSN